MRIGLDITPLQTGHRMRGVGQYTRHLVKEFAWLAGADQFHLFAYGGLPLDLPELPVQFTLHYMSQFSRTGRAAAFLSHQIWLPLALRRLKLDLFHAPFVSRDPSVPGIPFWQSVPTVATLHDLTPLHFPEVLLNKRQKRLFYMKQLGAARRVQHILTDSEHSRNDIVARLGVDPARVTVVQLGVETHLQPFGIAPLSVQPPYILHVGGDFFNKNVDTLLKAIDFLRSRGDFAHQLHLVGSYQREQTSGEASHVVRLAGISQEELDRQYSSASLFAFPSLYEGFGLPPLEAMSYGVPVVAARSSSLPEVLGDAAIYVEPMDVEGWAAAIHSVISDSALAEKLRERGLARARQFPWSHTAEQTLAVYRSQAVHSGRLLYARGV